MKFDAATASEIVLAANRAGLETALVGAIVEQESGGLSWAVRFEPGWRYFVRPNGAPGSAGDVRGVAPCSNDTERTCQAMSFGLMQVMGSVAREHGFRGPFLTRLLDPAMGLDYGCRVLKALRSRHELEEAISAYNAGEGGIGSNPAYVTRVLGFYRRLRVEGI